jgi:HEAT repeat protein/predicted DNA-binding WGR domain protein
MRTFQYTGDGSNKFWNIDVQGNTHTINFGKIGTKGQTQRKTFPDEAAAQAAAEKLIKEKLKGGYVETTAGAAAAPAAAPAPKSKPAAKKAPEPEPAPAPDLPEVGPPPEPVLREPDPALRQTLVLALGEALAGCLNRGASLDDDQRAALHALVVTAQADSIAAVRGQALQALTRLYGAALGEEVLQACLRALRDPDPGVRLHAVEALGQVDGTKAEPLLRAALAQPNNLVRRGAFQALLKRQPPDLFRLLMERLDDKDWAVSATAAEELGKLGEQARTAVPSLCKALSSRVKMVRDAALKSMAVLDPEGTQTVPALTEALLQRNLNVRSWAAEQLGKQGEKAAAAVPCLVLLVPTWQAGVGRQANTAIQAIGAAAVPGLTQTLTHSDEKIRKRALEAMRSIHNSTYQVLRPFEEQLGKPPPDVVKKMNKALKEFGGGEGGGPTTGVTGLKKQLKDRSWRTRWEAAIALGKMGKKALPALEDLTKALDDSDYDVREKAAQALGLIGPDAAPAVPKLLEKLQDHREQVRVQAILAVSRIGQAPDEALETLLNMLKEEDSSPQMIAAAAEILAQQGDRALPALPHLIRNLRHQNFLTRIWSARALGRLLAGRVISTGMSTELAEQVRDGTAGLRRMLEDLHPQALAWGAAAFHDVTGEVEPLLPIIRRLLPCRQADVRDGVTVLVRRAGDAARPILREALRHPDPRFRRGAALVLGKLGAQGQAALAEVEAAATNDTDAVVRKLAEEAVPKIRKGVEEEISGPRSAPTPEQLREMLLQVLQRRFGKLPEPIHQRVAQRSGHGALGDRELENALDRAGSILSPEEILQEQP